MAKTSELACKNCKNWQWPETGTTGQCRAHPPTVVVRASAEAAFPLTQETDWCGEFESGNRRAAVEKEKADEEAAKAHEAEKAEKAAKAHESHAHAKSAH